MALLKQVQVEVGGVLPGVLDDGPTSHALAVSRTSASGTEQFYLMVNAYWEPLKFTLPSPTAAASQGWRLWLDTGQPAPGDIHEPNDMPAVAENGYLVGPRSVVVLVARQQVSDAPAS
jgi:glycogen operon protein